MVIDGGLGMGERWMGRLGSSEETDGGGVGRRAKERKR